MAPVSVPPDRLSLVASAVYAYPYEYASVETVPSAKAVIFLFYKLNEAPKLVVSILRYRASAVACEMPEPAVIAAST